MQASKQKFQVDPGFWIGLIMIAGLLYLSKSCTGV